MLMSVTFAVASRVNIRNPPELYNPLKFLYGSGTKFRWTSSPVFLDQKKETMRSLSSSTGSPRLLTLYLKEKIKAAQLAELYIAEIVSLHGIPLEISSDHGSLFTSRYWTSFMEAFGTRLNLSTAYHPQSQGQVERVNQVPEDMLRACVLSFSMKWEEAL